MIRNDLLLPAVPCFGWMIDSLLFGYHVVFQLTRLFILTQFAAYHKLVAGQAQVTQLCLSSLLYFSLVRIYSVEIGRQMLEGM